MIVNYCHGRECLPGQKPELYAEPMGRAICKDRENCHAWKRLATNPAPDELPPKRRVMSLPRVDGRECHFYEPVKR